jgi:ADP-ribose pyrophosphatase YjhB (NUDIX family)
MEWLCDNHTHRNLQMPPKSPRIAVRAIILHENRLLLVNAWAGQKSPLMCAPGGGANVGTSLPENLTREVYEETGLTVTVGAPALVNEFHSIEHGFHQVEVFFRCTLVGSTEIAADWKDTEDVVNRHVWVTQDELADVMYKPSSLGAVAFDPEQPLRYDSLEQIVS